jgi:predicted nuclease with RNAse H fold
MGTAKRQCCETLSGLSARYTDSEILEKIIRSRPVLIAIDAPLSLPKKGAFFRKADREMIRKGYRVFPPNLPAMKKLALRAIRLNRLIEEKAYKTIEVHPTSTRKALQMPLKDWKAIQEILKTLGLKGARAHMKSTPLQLL